MSRRCERWYGVPAPGRRCERWYGAPVVSRPGERSWAAPAGCRWPGEGAYAVPVVSRRHNAATNRLRPPGAVAGVRFRPDGGRPEGGITRCGRRRRGVPPPVCRGAVERRPAERRARRRDRGIRESGSLLRRPGVMWGRSSATDCLAMRAAPDRRRHGGEGTGGRSRPDRRLCQWRRAPILDPLSDEGDTKRVPRSHMLFGRRHSCWWGRVPMPHRGRNPHLPAEPGTRRAHSRTGRPGPAAAPSGRRRTPRRNGCFRGSPGRGAPPRRTPAERGPVPPTGPRPGCLPYEVLTPTRNCG